jgi:thiamine kinase-like enzyme
LIDYLKKFSDVMYLLRPHLIKQPCHNDLNKHNILFNAKTYFIDWEAAGLEDPFFDLATLCNEFIGSQEQEQYFLKEYFGQEPTAQQEAKLLLMKQVSLCYLALHYFIHAANGGLVLNNELIQQERNALAPWIQKYNIKTQALSDPKDYLNYGLMQLEISSTQMKTEQFSHAKMILQGSLQEGMKFPQDPLYSPLLA